MAKMNDAFSFTGSISNISVYKMRGIDKPIVRTKGGPSKEKIKNSPKFEKTRKNNAEFGGRAAASRWIMQALWHQKPLADYNIAGPLNTLMKPIQVLDTASEPGQRNIVLSKNPRLLEGFLLNRRHPFDSVVRNPISFTLLRHDLTARIDIPALLPEINFHPQASHPMYSLVATIGLIPDLYYHQYGYQPLSEDYIETGSIMVETDWYTVMNGSPATVLELKYPIQPPDEHFSLVLAIGIRFGTMRDAVTVEQVPYAGAAKVLAMG